MPMCEGFINKIFKRRNRRAVLLLEQGSRDAAFYHELTYSPLSLFLSETMFFLVCKGFSFYFSIAIVQAYWV